MIYRELEPSALLRARGLGVECIWILDQEPCAVPAPEKILPDGCLELIFNLAAPYRQGDVDSDGAAAEQPISFLVGQLKSYIEIVATGRVSMIGVRFQPTGLHRLLGIPLADVTDRFVGLDEWGDRGLRELEERLHDAGSWPERVRLIEEHLLAMTPCTRAASRVGRMEAAVNLIRGSHGRLDLGRVTRAIDVSARTLDRRFGIEVGLSPKLFSRQVRFRRVFDLLSREPRPSWAEVALASGCFDQAHLNREFRSFAGEAPAAFMRSRHELSDHLTGLAQG